MTRESKETEQGSESEAGLGSFPGDGEKGLESTGDGSGLKQGVDERLVPVSEAIRYRKRAQAAEQQLTGLQEQIEATQKQLSEARETIEHLERPQKIDQMLAESEAMDLEVARLLTEAAVSGMEKPDVRMAIEDLKRHKPYLFRRRTGGVGASAMAAHAGGGGKQAAAEQAAQKAATSGDRRDLLRYLRLRRTPTPGPGSSGTI